MSRGTEQQFGLQLRAEMNRKKTFLRAEEPEEGDQTDTAHRKGWNKRGATQKPGQARRWPTTQSVDPF